MTNSGKPAIFITGIAGFIGSLLAATFKQMGFPVFGIDNLSTGYTENLPLFAKDKDWWVLELATRMNIEKLTHYMSLAKMQGNGELIVVHTAAPAYDANSHLLATLVTEGVCVGTSTTIMAAIRAKATRFINFSSMARYENNNLDLGKMTIGYREMDPARGMTPYGVAKCKAEQDVEFQLGITGIPWMHVVLHNVIGVGQQYNNPARNVAAMWMNLALHDKPIVIHGAGTQKRTYTPWELIRDVLVEVILNPKFEGFPLNIGTDPQYSMSLNELATLVFKTASQLTGKQIAPKVENISSSNIVSMQTAICNHSLMKAFFGKLATPDFERSLLRMGSRMLEIEKDFDYSVFESPDLGREALDPVYRDQTMTIRPN